MATQSQSATSNHSATCSCAKPLNAANRQTDDLATLCQNELNSFTAIFVGHIGNVELPGTLGRNDNRNGLTDATSADCALQNQLD